jgi:hypothetical protein
MKGEEHFVIFLKTLLPYQVSKLKRVKYPSILLTAPAQVQLQSSNKNPFKNQNFAAAQLL